MMPPASRLLFELHAKLPAYRRRIDRARKIVEEAQAEMSTPYLAYSTGKDSTVTADLVWQLRPDVPAVYFDADCAFPESYALLGAVSEQHTVIRWRTEPLLDTFARCGGPTSPGIGAVTMESTVYAPIRALLVEHHYDGVFLGLRSEESEGRARSAKYHGATYRYKRDGVLRCLPVAHLTYRDIWAYIVERGLAYNGVYDRMWDMPEADQRVSYWAGETKVRWGRWVFLRREYPDLFNRFAEHFPEVRCFI